LLKDRLRQLREERDLSQRDVAEMLHISVAAYGFYEQGRRDPGTEALNTLANFYGCSVDYLLGLTNVRERSIRISEQNSVPVPLIGVIRAGVPIMASENIEGYVLVSPEEARNGQYFYLRVSGDSMNNARIFDGDLVYVRQQKDVDTRDIAVVIVDGENATVKRVIKSDDGIILQPESTNPTHVPQYFKSNDPELRIVGKVMHVKFKVST
jgi:repressor LexA